MAKETVSESPRGRLAEPLFPFFLLPFLVFIFTPALIASENDVPISTIPPASLVGLFGLASYVLLFLLIIRRLAKGSRTGSLFNRTIHYLSFFVLTTSLVFPVAANDGLTDPSNLGVAIGPLLASTIVAVVLFALSRSARGHYVNSFLGILLILNVSLLVFSEYQARTQPDRHAVASETSNIFVLSFDGLSRSSVNRVLSADPDLENELRGFVYFDNAAASSPGTLASIFGELSGNQSSKSRFKTQEQAWTLGGPTLLTNVLGANGYEVTTYYAYGTGLNSGRRLAETTMRQELASTLLDLSFARTLTPVSVPTGRVKSAMQGFLVSADHPADQAESELKNRLSGSLSPQWSHNLALSILDFDRYVRNLEVGGVQPSAHFLHFTHTHFPLQFDEACEYRAHEPEWFAENQNVDGFDAITKCALAEMAEFLDKLKALGVYDEAVIVLKSDHGKPNGYQAPGTLEATPIWDHPMWGVGRYSPFLAIKPRHSVTTGLTRNAEPVLLDDLARTLCLASMTPYDCTQYPGFDLLDPALNIPGDALVTVFVIKSAESNEKLDTHVPITIRRGNGIVESLYDAVTAEDRG